MSPSLRPIKSHPSESQDYEPETIKSGLASDSSPDSNLSLPNTASTTSSNNSPTCLSNIGLIHYYK